jgi:hypothetical protein
LISKPQKNIRVQVFKIKAMIMRYKNGIIEIARGCLFLAIMLTILGQTSCKKYLEKKPRQDIAVPTRLSDLQAILNNEVINGNSPGDLEFIADNYYLENSSWNNSQVAYRSSYIWDKGAIQTSGDELWFKSYFGIYQANFVLDQLPNINITESESAEYNNVKGAALFYRSFMFYQLAQLFCRPFSPSAKTDAGIILRLTSTVDNPSVRSTVEQTYAQIISDLKNAAHLLPFKSSFITLPNRDAAYGMLARVYLSMSDYVNAGNYADSVLTRDSTLLDYNSLTPLTNPTLPFFTNNPEILYLSYEGLAPALRRSHEQLIDSLLYRSYDSRDLRKTVFFGAKGNTGAFYWQGSYYNRDSPTDIFDGVAIDEIYLIRAECRARAGMSDQAMNDLNKLLRNRWQNGFFNGLFATDATDALNKVLAERRKELLFRGVRWTDLRRLNLEGANITLTRVVNGITYTLPPNDLRWVLLIPNLEISRSGIAQNPR